MTAKPPTSEYRIHPAALIVVAVAVVIAIVSGIVALAMSASNSDATPAPVPTTSTEDTPTLPVAKSSQETIDKKLRERILAYESALLIPDATKRLEAITPYVTDEYKATLPTKNDDTPAAKAGLSMTFAVSQTKSVVNVEIEEDGTTMFVDTLLQITTKRHGDVVNTYVMQHATTWVKQSDEWYVYSETQTK